MNCERCEIAKLYVNSLCELASTDREMLAFVAESYSCRDHNHQPLTYSIVHAKAIVDALQLEPQQIPEDHLTEMLRVNSGWDEEHVNHVPDTPGIVARIDLPEGYALLLIDGTHRAAKARKEGRPFFAYYLDNFQGSMCRL